MFKLLRDRVLIVDRDRVLIVDRDRVLIESTLIGER